MQAVGRGSSCATLVGYLYKTDLLETHVCICINAVGIAGRIAVVNAVVGV